MVDYRTRGGYDKEESFMMLNQIVEKLVGKDLENALYYNNFCTPGVCKKYAEILKGGLE